VRIFAANSRTAVVLVAAAAVLPRLVVLLVERGSILTAYTEKSDDFARTFVASGTYGFVAGHPSALTQPLYGFFLIPIYWIFGRSWESVGLAQILVAALTALTVLAIARRIAPRLAVLAAVVATLNPYLIWHDVHVNREILDQLVLALIVLTVLLALERRTLRWVVLTGALCGVAVLGNPRLLAVPLLVGVFLAVLKVGRPAVTIAVVVVAAGVVVSPWVIRNKVSVGCFAVTTDGRALWKANNPLTYTTLAHGKWIDDVPQPRSFPPSPEDAAVRFEQTGVYPPIDECAQMSHFQDLALTWMGDHPGAKAKLAVQATGLLWDPRSHETQGRSGKGTWRDTARRVVEPVWAIPVYALALFGLFLAPRAFAWLAGLLLLYDTADAWVFAGTTRYRIPFDFLLALLACAALERLASRVRYRASTPSAALSAEN
jgi:4-amino-4-deoxy-L-arabinose transferase-like glycosyltransferase